MIQNDLETLNRNFFELFLRKENVIRRKGKVTGIFLFFFFVRVVEAEVV